MRDPREGVDLDGHIRTGAHRSRVPALYEPVLAALSDVASAAPGRVSLYVYGSVATGTARPPVSDVDALVVGLGPSKAASAGQRLSEQFTHLCRAVEISAAQAGHYAEQGDAAYGDRAFLRHYCVHLSGPDLAQGWPPFAADVRAARGFNGDLAETHRRWVSHLEAIEGSDAAGEPTEDEVHALARAVARKTLLAVAGLVSVHDQTWTTDRASAAQRWGHLHPWLALGLAELMAWADSGPPRGLSEIRRTLQVDGTVHQVVTDFAQEVGMWR